MKGIYVKGIDRGEGKDGKLENVADKEEESYQ